VAAIVIGDVTVPVACPSTIEDVKPANPGLVLEGAGLVLRRRRVGLRLTYRYY
jgi:hypothetical protein